MLIDNDLSKINKIVKKTISYLKEQNGIHYVLVSMQNNIRMKQTFINLEKEDSLESNFNI